MLLDCVTLAKALCDVRNDQSESLTRDRREKERDREKADLYKRPKKKPCALGVLLFKVQSWSDFIYGLFAKILFKYANPNVQ